MVDEILLGDTESVCPQCLTRIPASKIARGEDVYLSKLCPEHGEFRALIWRGEPSYASWSNTKIPTSPTVCTTKEDRGCPYDCGLCSEHRRETCCVLLEVTAACNLRCPVCFASSDSDRAGDPLMSEIEAWYRKLKETGLSYNIQISGGEPTLRDDLPEIIRMGRRFGYTYLQLNTNGLRLGKEPDFVKALKEAGLNAVFLQFDGTTDEVYRLIRGCSLLELKIAAIENCAREGIGVVLVPTLVPEVNLHQLGLIIDFALARVPAVRGVHFQPISYFGRYPTLPPEDRITIPEILKAIEDQTRGRMKADNFLPPGAENAYCSFHGNFLVMEDGEVKPWGTASSKSCCQTIQARDSTEKARDFVARQWSGVQACSSRTKTEPQLAEGTEALQLINIASLDRYLERVKDYTLAISGMAFQDAWTLDLDRLRECIIHVVSPDLKIIPFCAYNLTAGDGRGLYRRPVGS